MKAKKEYGEIPQWMDTRQAALYLDRDPSSMKRWRHEGKGPKFVVVNRRQVRYHVSALEAWLKMGASDLD